jgi:hypothetical protein
MDELEERSEEEVDAYLSEVESVISYQFTGEQVEKQANTLFDGRGATFDGIDEFMDEHQLKTYADIITTQISDRDPYDFLSWLSSYEERVGSFGRPAPLNDDSRGDNGNYVTDFIDGVFQPVYEDFFSEEEK